MPPEAAADLHRAFLAAFRPFLVERLAGLGIDPGPFSSVLEAGEEMLDRDLGALLALPFGRQERTPLQVLRAALAPVAAALEAAGDAGPLDLAPASSQELGEAAWQSHLAWGIAKARALARPVVGLLSADLMDHTRVESEVNRAGFALEVWRRGAAAAAASRPPVVAFVDLAHPDSDEVIRLLAGRGTRVVGYGPHVDDFAMTRARSLGAADALARSAFFRAIREHLPTLA